MRQNKEKEMVDNLGVYLVKNFDSYLFNPFEEYSLEGIELFESELLSLRESLSDFNISFGDKAAQADHSYRVNDAYKTLCNVDALLKQLYLEEFFTEMYHKEKEGKIPVSPLDALFGRFYGEHFLKKPYEVDLKNEERFSSNYLGFLYAATLFLKFIYILKNYNFLSKGFENLEISQTRDLIIKLAGLSCGMCWSYLLAMSTTRLSVRSSKSQAGKARASKYDEIRDFCFEEYKKEFAKNSDLSHNAASHLLNHAIKSDFTGEIHLTEHSRLDTLRKWAREFKEKLGNN